MSKSIEELDFRRTKLGDITLRRRRSPSLQGEEIYEVILNNEFLMSSVVNASEIALAKIGLSGLGDGPLDVVVGGLGLGYTAQAALEFSSVRSVTVIEYLPEVIGWHRQGVVPLGPTLCGDRRCKIVEADFFGLMRYEADHLDPDHPEKKYHAVLVDIDHSPRSFLHPDHGGFYYPEGLQRLIRHLHPGGVFALWSAEKIDDAFQALFNQVFAGIESHEVNFYNPVLDVKETNTLYIATAEEASSPEP
ncbi:MAG: hypothetical protein R3236_00095 [Phycisphaeraceae bacterium]|nr:hypothetical protein [Phycisphaeraceae bacterium]